jgi:hypothetical protein
MAHKKKHTEPVPPGNRPQAGPGGLSDQTVPGAEQAPGGGAPLTDQDPKRRIGNYEGAGEPPFKQPGGKNDANH